MSRKIESVVGAEMSIIHYGLDYCCLDCTITKSCISIENSCKVHDDKDKKEVLSHLLNMFPEFGEHRKMGDLIDEWRAHNILYRWGVQIHRTGTVDLEARQDPFHRLGYWLISKLFADYDDSNRDYLMPPSAPAC